MKCGRLQLVCYVWFEKIFLPDFLFGHIADTHETIYVSVFQAILPAKAFWPQKTPTKIKNGRYKNNIQQGGFCMAHKRNYKVAYLDYYEECFCSCYYEFSKY
jgi:hypothetical protein